MEWGAMEETGGARADQTEKTGGTWNRRTQAAAMMATHSGADRGRSHGGGRADDSRELTDSGGAGGGGARGGDGEPVSQGDIEDLEGQGGADGSGDRGGGGDPEGCGGARGKEEPDRAGGARCSRRSGDTRRWMVGDWPRRSRRDDGTWRNLVDWGAMVERRVLGAMVESLGQRAEVESGTLRLEVETAVAIVRTTAEVVGEGGWAGVQDDQIKSNQIKSNQITFIVTSPQHKCLGEWNYWERAPDSAKKQNNLHIDSTYLQTVQKTMCKIHIHMLNTQCTIKTYLVTNTPYVHILHYVHIYT